MPCTPRTHANRRHPITHKHEHAQGRAKDHAVRKGVKAFSDALLDLLVDTEETQRYVKDLWGKQELLYLGPDEQVCTFFCPLVVSSVSIWARRPGRRGAVWNDIARRSE